MIQISPKGSRVKLPTCLLTAGVKEPDNTMPWFTGLNPLQLTGCLKRRLGG
nr:MAG TPA: hypothetical protein [Caudoviricetes sp.]